MDMAKISPEAQTTTKTKAAAFIQLQTTGHSLKMGAQVLDGGPDGSLDALYMAHRPVRQGDRERERGRKGEDKYLRNWFCWRVS